MLDRIPALLRHLRLVPLLAAACAGYAASAAEGVHLARFEPDRPAAGALPPQAEPTRGRRPLSEHDAFLYAEIFARQQAGDWPVADRLIGRLGDRVLLGHVLYQRYMHPTAWRSSYTELRDWLDRFADHPDADRVYDLALKRRPRGAAAPAAPMSGYLGGAGQLVQERVTLDYRSTRRRTEAEERVVQAWQAGVELLARGGAAQKALEAFQDQAAQRLIDPVEADVVRWRMAQVFLADGHDRLAFDLAHRAAERSGVQLPDLHWTAGISAWRLGRIEAAAGHFAALAQAERAHDVERSRAAFWAARAYLVSGKPQLVGQFLDIAARGSRDFYGLLARAVLGETMTYNFDRAAAMRGTLAVLMRHPGARRAMALGQIGQVLQAEREIRKLAPRATPDLMVGLIALAEELHLPATQMRLAQRLGPTAGLYHHGGLFPLPQWRPSAGLTLDQALIFAIIRAESAFVPDAESHVGALGLMQVMPATARVITRFADLALPKSDLLRNPEVGIAFGQAYLEHLLQYDSIGDNLIFLAAAYNAGPGRVPRWREMFDAANDPLLFLESIPVKETRIYVKKVLTNLWTYRARLGQPQPSLEDLAHNRWPRYQSLDASPALYAWN